MRAVAIPAVGTTKELNFGDFIPSALRDIGDLQTAIPRIAKDPSLLNSIRKSVERIPTKHVLVHGDARKIDRDLTGAIHLVITFPPYWTLKKYRDTSGQLGHISDYDEFLTEWIASGKSASSCSCSEVGWSASSAMYVFRAGRMTVVTPWCLFTLRFRSIVDVSASTTYRRLFGKKSLMQHMKWKMAEEGFLESRTSRTRS